MKHDLTDERTRWLVNFGERLEMLRANRGMERKELRRKAGISQGSYEGYIYGKHEPTAYVVLKLAEVLDVSADVLLGVDE